MMGISAIALILAAHTALATGADGTAAHNGAWLVPGESSPYTIDSKGLVGVDRKNCGAGYRQKISLDDGAKWLAVIAQAEKEQFLPAAHAQLARKEVQKGKRYPRIAYFCQGDVNDGLLIAPDTRLVMSCADGDCEVFRHVRVR